MIKIVKPEDNLVFKKIEKKEAISLIKKTLLCEFESEEKADLAVDILEYNYPGISDIIFWDKSSEKLTPEEILKKAKSENKPIQL